MVDPKSLALSLRQPSAVTGGDAAVIDDTWNWWNKFRLNADFDNKIYVCLELSADVPSDKQLKRWLGEPVAVVVIPADLFIRNAKNYPVLSQGHQAVLTAFQQQNVSFLIKCNENDRGLKFYSDYVRHLCTKNARADPMSG